MWEKGDDGRDYVWNLLCGAKLQFYVRSTVKYAKYTEIWGLFGIYSVAK